MTASSIPDVRFQSDDDHLNDYREFSKAAIFGFLLGLASILSLVGPILWAVPILGAVISGFALWSIRNSDQPVSGKTLAVLGLMLSMLFAFAAPARSISRDYWLKSRALEFSETWFEILNNPNRQHDYQLSLEINQRIGFDNTVDSSMPREVAESTGRDLTTRPVIQRLLKLQGKFDRELVKIQIHRDAGSDLAFPQYRIVPHDQELDQPFEVQLFLERGFTPLGEEGWFVNQVNQL